MLIPAEGQEWQSELGKYKRRQTIYSLPSRYGLLRINGMLTNQGSSNICCFIDTQHLVHLETDKGEKALQVIGKFHRFRL